MRGVLVFDLPGEMEQHQCAIDGVKWRSVVFDIDRTLAGIVKNAATDSEAEVAIAMQNVLHNAMTDNGVSLD